MQPSMEACAWIHQAQDRLWRQYVMRTSLGRQRVILGSAAGERSGGPGGRTRCALLTRYAFGDDTIGSRGFIAAVTRTAGPLPFGGAGL